MTFPLPSLPPLPLPDAVGRPAAAIRDTALALAGLPARALSLLSSAEQTLVTVDATVARIGELVARIEALLERMSGLADTAEQATAGAADVVDRARSVTARADDVVTAAERVSGSAAETLQQAGSTAASASSLLQRYRDPLRALEPTVRRLAETTEPKEIDALVSLIDRLPRLADAMDQEVIPLVRRLDQIGPDLHQLLEVASDLNGLVSRLPWWGRPEGTDEQT